MKRLSLFLLSILVVLSSLNCQKTGSITITEIKDSCYALMSLDNKDTLQAVRQLEIIENTFSDTTVLGYAVLLPGYTGKFIYNRLGESALVEGPLLSWPPTNMICIHFRKPTKGKLVIRYSLY